MTGSQSNTNRGYLFPDKGKGRLSLADRDVHMTCAWADAGQRRLRFEVTGAAGSSGHLVPNEAKANDKQPDWRGQLKDDQGREWAVSVWTRDKGGDRMFSLALTAQANGSSSTTGDRPVSPPASRNHKEFHPQAKVDMFESGLFGQSDAFWAWVDTEEAIPYIEAMAESRQPITGGLGILMVDDDEDDLLDDRHLAQLRKQIQARYGSGRSN